MGIKSRFCPACGKERGKFVDKICVDCYFHSVEIEIPSEVRIQACPSCDAIRVKGFWIKSVEDHNEFFLQGIVEKLKLPKNIELEDIEILQAGKEGEVQLNLSIASQRFSVVKPIALYLEDGLCDEDSRRKREAYQGILQLRSEKDPHKFVAATENILKQYSSSILKLEEQKNGVDVYFLDKESLNKVLGNLKKKF